MTSPWIESKGEDEGRPSTPDNRLVRPVDEQSIGDKGPICSEELLLESDKGDEKSLHSGEGAR